jgi:hypothetical protein
MILHKASTHIFLFIAYWTKNDFLLLLRAQAVYKFLDGLDLALRVSACLDVE